MKNKFDHILETIGNTPVVRINRLAPENVNLFVKLESFNPGGSVKDRLALGVIEAAEKSGELNPGQTIVEATSGNTGIGIGLAIVCAHKGYPLVIVMAENFSIERRRLMRFLGAKVIVTPAALKGSGMIAKAKELADEHGWFLTRQFENEANAQAHERTTAVEILRDFENEQLDYWVTGFGTGGTLNGIARVLKRERPTTKIVVCEPDNSQLIGSGENQPLGSGNGPTPSHPAFRPHAMQGWTPDFISALTEQAIAEAHIDELVPVAGADALQMSQELARKEGIFTGITGGASFAGALAIAKTAEPGSTILCMLPDTGERYLSTPLFEDIDSEMNAEENAIAESTPNYRFDNLQIPVDDQEEDNDANEKPATASALGRSTMNDFIDDKSNPVVMFALEWCEFCWAARKMFKALDIPYVSVDLDSVNYAESGEGAEIRAALLEKLGNPTIPQIFIGTKSIGGCSELFAANDDGSLKEILEQATVSYNNSKQVKGADFLPNWVRK
jgi:cysteine synthase